MNKAKRTVYPNWSFFWNTRLEEKRMQEISDFLGKLSKEDREKVEDLARDISDESCWEED